MSVDVALNEVQNYFSYVKFNEETVREIQNILGVEVNKIDVSGIDSAVAVLLTASKKVDAYHKLVELLHPTQAVVIEKTKRVRRSKAVVQAEKEAIAKAKAEAAKKGE
jgi:hypothetical protein